MPQPNQFNAITVKHRQELEQARKQIDRALEVEAARLNLKRQTPQRRDLRKGDNPRFNPSLAKLNLPD